MKTPSEVKMADGWHYNTAAGPSAASYPTRDAARAGKKVVDTAASVGVNLPQSPITASVEQISQEKMMTFTFKSLSKNGKNAFYTGGATVLRFALSAFPNKQHPTSFDVADGVFAEPKAAKVALTDEEKAAAKAARAAKPKPTLAEKIEARRKALAALEAKAAAAANQPQL